MLRYTVTLEGTKCRAKQDIFISTISFPLITFGVCFDTWLPEDGQIVHVLKEQLRLLCDNEQFLSLVF